MKRKITMLTILMTAVLLCLPVDSFSSTVETPRSATHGTTVDPQKKWKGGHGRKRRYNRGRNRYYYGYRNYGQYRRTQVGNRRYRLVRRYYWRDGIRLSRWVRIYY